MGIKTTYWTVSADQPEPEIIQRAAEIIINGGLVAFPTETVYGLGADGTNPQAVRRIFAAKGRPSDNPLILHVACKDEVLGLATEVNAQARQLMQLFWPGPLTLVLPKKPCVPEEVTAGLDTVAIRMPRHPVALALIAASGVPIAAPSANLSGYPSPTTGRHVYEDLAGRIEAVLDSGETGVGLESTVLDLSGPIPVILRPGGVTREELTAVLGTVIVDQGLSDPRQKPKAPGMKYVHYSPRAEVVLIHGPREQNALKIRELVTAYADKGKKIGLLLTRETWRHLPDLKGQVAYAQDLGSCARLEEIAHLLYRELRNCDEARADVVFTETYPEEGIGAALMNRLLKAAGYKVIDS
ncbi:MAG TPA: L-threonylcarbamoyladenylate synthase [Peptococcaceae bacterium]|jgi:L-threonylcarbamoyladenylate synthase|nr:threonylcarbamoyl-AMP synthase [Clostridia bacterium]HPZ70942.1 L-threonylcarbamoyladenylate synthase [Peptococcaceae bacterium]HQD54338.1 L-threonylcarbamoyladenylate synthase [Peptococcaceae bacterium]